MAEVREPELVRREIALERDQLVRSIAQLRSEMLDARGRVRARLKSLLAVVALGVVVLASLRALVGLAVGRLRR